MPSPVLNEFNYQLISVLQNNLTTIHGIFSLLHELNGDFGTRYNIEANPREEFSAESLDRYFEWTDNKKYWAVDGSKNITINFNEPFLLSGYAISNGVQSEYGNSFPTGWKLYGFDKETNKRILLNKQTNQEFCGKHIETCKTENVKGFYISFQYRAFKSFIFEQTTNSGGNDYIFMTLTSPIRLMKNHATITKQIQDYSKKILNVEVKKYQGLHSIRRMFATKLVNSNVDSKTASQMLGHTSFSSDDRYMSYDRFKVMKCALNFQKIQIEGGVYFEDKQDDP